MSYKDLRHQTPPVLFVNACTYANQLWSNGHPARAILALCRSIYLAPGQLPPGTRQPYDAFVWFLQRHEGRGFMGNPRISFAHQATRIESTQILKRQRAWALWLLSRAVLPDLPPNPKVVEAPPSVDDLIRYLDSHGLPGEGSTFSRALAVARARPLQEPDGVDPSDSSGAE